jgi:hypothetical protein
LDLLFHEYLILEAYLDPYFLIEKLNNLTSDSQGQKLIQDAFDVYLSNDLSMLDQTLKTFVNMKILGSMEAYFEKINSTSQLDKVKEIRKKINSEMNCEMVVDTNGKKKVDQVMIENDQSVS